MGKRSRSVRMKPTPVVTGAGRMRMFTGTPECKPIPEASTGRCTVVSNRKANLPHLDLLLHQARNVTTSISCRRTCESYTVAKAPHFGFGLWQNRGAMRARARGFRGAAG